MEKTSADIIIIGGGAAGLMAAAGCAFAANQKRNIEQENTAPKPVKVIILEKMPRAGRKIMITGKGRCNITNVKPWNEFQHHIHPKANFLKPSFYNLSSEAMLGFLSDIGLETIIERGDRAYPSSYNAADVVDTLVQAATESGAKLICNKTVSDTVALQTNDSKTAFRVNCADGSEFTCRKLIICTGGLSYPRTGSTGDGYRWAKGFGHKIKHCLPSLTAIVPKSYKQIIGKPKEGHINRDTPLSELGELLCGNQLKNVNLSLMIDGNEVISEFGDLDFTDGGIEGPIGFKISRKCVYAIASGSKATVTLDLKPAVSEESLSSRINNLWKDITQDRRSAGRQYRDKFKVLLCKLMPMDLVPAFMKMHPNADHKSLARYLKAWRFEIEGYVGYERSVVTAGGISLEGVTAKTLESKVVSGLYFAGEVLDLDGDTGGYNLQTAFSTGYLAGISAYKAL